MASIGKAVPDVVACRIVLSTKYKTTIYELQRGESEKM